MFIYSAVWYYLLKDMILHPESRLVKQMADFRLRSSLFSVNFETFQVHFGTLQRLSDTLQVHFDVVSDTLQVHFKSL